jgi:hypothetical protein
MQFFRRYRRCKNFLSKIFAGRKPLSSPGFSALQLMASAQTHLFRMVNEAIANLSDMTTGWLISSTTYLLRR